MLANRLLMSKLRRSSRWSATDKGANVTVSADRKTASVSNGNSARGEQSRSSGVLQFEITIVSAPTNVLVGVCTAAANLNSFPGSGSGSWGYFSVDGKVWGQGTAISYGSAYSIGDVIGVVVDFTLGQLRFYKNGSTPGVAATGLAGLNLFPMAGSGTGTPTFYPVKINTGETPFAHPISGASPWG